MLGIRIAHTPATGPAAATPAGAIVTTTGRILNATAAGIDNERLVGFDLVDIGKRH